MNHLKFAADFEGLDESQGRCCSVVLTRREADSQVASIRLRSRYDITGEIFHFEMSLKRRLLNSISNAFSRPELDFDFLLNEKNLDLIKENIRCRKGIGDIDAVHRLWKQIQDYSGKPKQSEQEYQSLWDKLYKEAMLIPNLCHPSVAKGNFLNAHVIRFFGEKRKDDNLETAETIAKAWKALYNPLNACGERSYAFIGPLADMELALLDYVSSVLEQKGFLPIVVPDIVHESIPEGCGLQQRSEKDILYRLRDYSDFCLSGTSEMGLSSLVSGRVFGYDELPLKLKALSRCFRPEIATNAAESKLYRVHEFNKVEMFVICNENESDLQLDELVEVQTSIFSSLGLHCRLLDMPSEELGASAARKFDIEAWMPGRKMFGEVSSASNCTDYQARRLSIKYRDSNGVEKFAHTCNATAVATTRTLIALLETYQDERKRLLALPDDILQRMPKTRSWTISLHKAVDINTSRSTS
ncbi:seryl-tRNA synthetase [Loa loa]|uniref:serine--tRNA ligase n=1 Tax=Loa loa TaxID=7209 RepID=A0A1I7VI93_LOALO|nr:seryl-tRNA synthetase [Loa loa]EFO27750.2 seryl-tRNA synthetase [Loa loa]